MKKNLWIKIGIGFFMMSLLILGIVQIGKGTVPNGDEEVEKEVPVSICETTQVQAATKSGQTAKTSVYVNTLDFSRVSKQKIKLTWSDKTDAKVKKYVIMRADVNGNTTLNWQKVGEVASDQKVNKTRVTYTDTLQNTEKKQYWYRVDVVVSNTRLYKAKKGKKMLASNVLICIDPGHYKGSSDPCDTNSYNYTEGVFTLQIGLQLKKNLKQQYGIDSVMTRDSDVISIDGYSNQTLDRGHISLRGAYAAKSNSDLFVSLHTNANNEKANGYPTWNQPVAINKTIILANTTVCGSTQWLYLCNCIGTEVTQANADMGLIGDYGFENVQTGTVKDWTDQYNDSLTVGGTVCRRLSSGRDYYGVLRGAAEAGVPGIIIEHGYHTIEEVRKQAMEGDLKIQWANADAKGIAKGLGFVAKY